MIQLAREVTGQELEDLIASLGGHDAVSAGIRWYGERCDLFDSRRNELTAKYPTILSPWQRTIPS